MVTLADTAKLTIGQAPVLEELKMTNARANWKAWSAPNNFVVPPLAKLGGILVKNVLKHCLARLAF